VNGFYTLLTAFLAHQRDERFLAPAHHALLAVEDDAERLLDRLVP